MEKEAQPPSPWKGEHTPKTLQNNQSCRYKLDSAPLRRCPGSTEEPPTPRPPVPLCKRRPFVGPWGQVSKIGRRVPGATS